MKGASEPKILIVDDEPANHHVYKRLLEDVDVEIVQAMCGEDALKVAHRHDFFLILMDVQMPGIDGFEAASMILDNPKTKHIPVIFVTAIGKSDTFEFQGYKSGAVDYLTKPINEDILLSKIGVFLDLYLKSSQLEKEVARKEKAEAGILAQNKEFEAFGSRVAHDLRNPLGALLNMTELFLMDLPDTGRPEKVEVSVDDLELIKRQAQVGLNIVEGIYELSGLGGESLVFSITPLTEIINHAIVHLDKQIRESKAELSIETSDRVVCSEKMLPQVFQNLIVNSIKFTRDLRAPVIKITSKEIEGGVRICYEDNGPGIPEESREKIFGAFERLHGANIEGLGIGLSMVKKIVELHGGGAIKVGESELLKGVSFTFDLKATLPTGSSSSGMLL